MDVDACVKNVNNKKRPMPTQCVAVKRVAQTPAAPDRISRRIDEMQSQYSSLARMVEETNAEARRSLDELSNKIDVLTQAHENTVQAHKTMSQALNTLEEKTSTLCEDFANLTCDVENVSKRVIACEARLEQPKNERKRPKALLPIATSQAPEAHSASHYHAPTVASGSKTMVLGSAGIIPLTDLAATAHGNEPSVLV